jgi:hypothetical protein
VGPGGYRARASHTRCLRFAVRVTPPPTQDSLAAGGRPLPRRVCTCWARFGEFQRWLRHPFLPPQASPGAIQQPAREGVGDS